MHPKSQWGALQAENIPFEPDPDNAGEGKKKMRLHKFLPHCFCLTNKKHLAMKNFFLILLFALCTQQTFSQSVVRGKVISNNEQPLPGANIKVKELEIGSSTDDKGEFYFSINSSSKHLTLITSFLGFKTDKREIEITDNLYITIILEEQAILTQEIIVSALRADENTPTSYSNINSETIKKWETGRDIPYLLQLTPSVVATSDAGAGIGYTTFRIRGTDQTRINITINDIPLNDPESHQVFWVNTPDLSENTNSIQIQRGVGTSSNGAAAFGASVNIQTHNVESKPYAEINNAVGSFGTIKNTAKAGTGILTNNFYFDARVSKIKSDGFIDRAFADMKSFYVSGGYLSDKHILKANVFGGNEITYQSWEGVPKVRIENDTVGMLQFAEDSEYSPEETENLLNSDSRTFNRYMYKNQIDNYTQNHYQFFYTYKHSSNFNVNAALFCVTGEGYYESYRYNKKLSNFRLPNIVMEDTITRTDLITRKWLDNIFYGFTGSATYSIDNLKVILGGGANRYDCDHFGNVIWAKHSGGQMPENHEYYRSRGIKDDANIYLKANYRFAEYFNLYGDIQMRFINYTIEGIDDKLYNVAQKHKFDFFNPKLGILYQKESLSAFVSVAQSHREPSRSNFIDADTLKPPPTFEKLMDLEIGISYKSHKTVASATYYYMNYDNQLVLTGNINNVGAAIMENVKQSYRTGVELQALYKPFDWLEWSINATFSANKIKNFIFYIDDWDNWGQEIDTLKTTDIAFSPKILVGSVLTVKPFENLSISLIDNYVGEQYIDNSSNPDRILNAYWVTNLRLNYEREIFGLKANIFLQINNLYNKYYSNNAWIYTYRYNNEIRTMDGYFTQAGINFMAGLNMRF